jgi:hypothetical protein
VLGDLISAFNNQWVECIESRGVLYLKPLPTNTMTNLTDEQKEEQQEEQEAKNGEIKITGHFRVSTANVNKLKSIIEQTGDDKDVVINKAIALFYYYQSIELQGGKLQVKVGDETQTVTIL